MSLSEFKSIGFQTLERWAVREEGIPSESEFTSSCLIRAHEKTDRKKIRSAFYQMITLVMFPKRFSRVLFAIPGDPENAPDPSGDLLFASDERFDAFGKQSCVERLTKRFVKHGSVKTGGSILIAQ
jgi:hypothetical protein